MINNKTMEKKELINKSNVSSIDFKSIIKIKEELEKLKDNKEGGDPLFLAEKLKDNLERMSLAAPMMKDILLPNIKDVESWINKLKEK